jgi:type III pantothenate kinase
MHILVDIGNTNIKWGLCLRHRFALSQIHQLPLCNIAQLWQTDKKLKPQSLWVANVAHQDLNAIIRTKSQTYWQLNPIFAQSEAQADGIDNGYQQPTRLGVDRWLALIAAHQLYPHENLAVVDCGSAITLDILTINAQHAQHQGGLIFAGLYSLQHTITNITAGVSAPTQPLAIKSGTIVAQDTQTAVALGAIRMVTAAIETTLSSFQPMRCLLTGGDGSKLLPYLDINCEYHPHLVLQGLAYKAKIQCVQSF